MDWTTLGTTLGSVLVSNFFVAFASLRTAKWHINSANKQLDKQLQSEREREQSQRNREVRGAPLEKLKEELADFAARVSALYVLKDEKQHVEQFDALRRETFGPTYVINIKRTLYLLDQREIINRVEEMISVFDEPSSVNSKKVIERIRTIDSKVLEIQALINDTLEKM
jgi:hypothetical protein